MSKYLTSKYYHYHILAIFFIIFITIFIVDTYKTINDNYHGFLSKTICRICDKNVWIWQNYERRKYKVPNKSQGFISVSMSGIVHKDCIGIPKVNIKIEVE